MRLLVGTESAGPPVQHSAQPASQPAVTGHVVVVWLNVWWRQPDRRWQQAEGDITFRPAWWWDARQGL